MTSKEEMTSKTIANANKFMKSHDSGLMPVSETLYLMRGIDVPADQRERLFDAISNAYNMAYRRGYTRARKDLTGK